MSAAAPVPAITAASISAPAIFNAATAIITIIATAVLIVRSFFCWEFMPNPPPHQPDGKGETGVSYMLRLHQI